MPSVLFVAPSAYTLSGLATWLDYLLPGLRECGWDATLGLVSGPSHHRPDRYLGMHPDAHAVAIHCATGTPEGRRRALDRALASVRPDLAVSVNIPDLFAAINHRRVRGESAPHAVLSVHGIEAYLYADAARYREALDAVVCTNRLACALTGALGGVSPERVLYAAYGVRRAARGEAGAAAPLRVVYSGRLEQAQKRVGDLPAIVRGLQAQTVPFVLEIAGDGPERSALEDAFATERAAGEVVFHGQLPIEALKAGPYARAHALLITSFWETGPIVVWEAMAQGVPVVSARYIGSGREGALRHDDNALLFDIGDAATAAAQLARLAREPDLHTRLRDAALDLVHTRYDIPVSVASWNRALRAVLAQPARAAADLPTLPPAGRLDRWLGTDVAETLRAFTTSRTAPDPGGEWPHAHSRAPSDATFWTRAQATDRENDHVE